MKITETYSCDDILQVLNPSRCSYDSAVTITNVYVVRCRAVNQCSSAATAIITTHWQVGPPVTPAIYKGYDGWDEN